MAPPAGAFSTLGGAVRWPPSFRVANRGAAVPCNRLRRMIFLWVDRDRAELLRERLERHLEQCPSCRQRAVEVERVVLTLRSCCRRESVPTRLVERIRIRIEAE